MATKDPYQRIEIGMKLNRSANELFAYYITHMNKEEVTILPATWEHLTDEQLLEIRAIVEANIPSERYAEWMRWVLPSLNINELVFSFRTKETILQSVGRVRRIRIFNQP